MPRILSTLNIMLMWRINMFMKSCLDMLHDYGCGVTSNVIKSNAGTNAAMEIRL